jgi:DNA replication protein DnaC
MTPRLYLDEIDKFVLTDFKVKKLMQLVDAIYAAEGQVVATSNSSLQELARAWGMKEAVTVIRRIGIGEKSHTVVFTLG